MKSVRPDDAINHDFDNMAISILLTEDPDEDKLMQSSVTTFLRQISNLQICSETTAHSFSGGVHDRHFTV